MSARHTKLVTLLATWLAQVVVPPLFLSSWFFATVNYLASPLSGHRAFLLTS